MKSEKGSVTAITVITILFILTILGAYMGNVYAKRKAQLQETMLLQEIYDGDMSKIYEEQVEKRDRKAAYTDVLYIEATGTQYIDTEVKASQNTSIKMIVEFTDLSIDQTLFCARQDFAVNTFTVFQIGNKFRSDYNTEQSGCTQEIVANKKYNIYANKNKFYINDTLATTHTEGTFATPENIYLMASYVSNYQTIGNFAKYKLYGTEIYDGNTLVRNLVPCYRNSDKKAGLYDTVNDKFYTNIGNGEFSIGPEI